MYLNGKEIKAPTVQAAIRNKLAYVPEDRKTLGLNLLDSIKQTIAAANLGALVHGGLIDRDEEYRVANGYRTSLRIKAPSVDVGVATLSGGNQQKVVLAKWMYPDPDILILDEPTRGIDVGAKFEIYKLIQALADQGKGVIVISSELPRAAGDQRPDLHHLRGPDHRRAPRPPARTRRASCAS